ncbi:hypothetical protein DL771_004351 [Monosporascus sp. 5C6A]|nr:hypothetical protein DL771_004351 [Monosporascus sp. 5C6A]
MSSSDDNNNNTHTTKATGCDDGASTFSTGTFSSTKELIKNKFRRSSSSNKDSKSGKDDKSSSSTSQDELMKQAYRGQLINHT